MNEPRSIDLLAQLLSQPTVSRNPNLGLIHFIRDYLADWGVASELFLNAEGSKASLYATLGPTDAAAWPCPATPTWCRWTARPGRWTLLP